MAATEYVADDMSPAWRRGGATEEDDVDGETEASNMTLMAVVGGIALFVAIGGFFSYKYFCPQSPTASPTTNPEPTPEPTPVEPEPKPVEPMQPVTHLMSAQVRTSFALDGYDSLEEPKVPPTLKFDLAAEDDDNDPEYKSVGTVAKWEEDTQTKRFTKAKNEKDQKKKDRQHDAQGLNVDARIIITAFADEAAAAKFDSEVQHSDTTEAAVVLGSSVGCQADLCDPERAQYQLVLASMSPIQLQNFMRTDKKKEKESKTYQPIKAMEDGNIAAAKMAFDSDSLKRHKDRCEDQILVAKNLIKTHEATSQELATHKTDIENEMNAIVGAGSSLETFPVADEDAAESALLSLKNLCAIAVKAREFEFKRIGKSRDRTMKKGGEFRHLFSLATEVEQNEGQEPLVKEFAEGDVKSCSAMSEETNPYMSGCVPKGGINSKTTFSETGFEKVSPLKVKKPEDEDFKSKLASAKKNAKEFSELVSTICEPEVNAGGKVEVRPKQQKAAEVAKALQQLREQWQKSIDKTIAAAGAFTECGNKLAKHLEDWYGQAKAMVDDAIQDDMTGYDEASGTENTRKKNHPHAARKKAYEAAEQEAVFALRVPQPTVRFVVVGGVLDAANKKGQHGPQGTWYKQARHWLGLDSSSWKPFPLWQTGTAKYRLTPVERISKQDERETPELQEMVSTAQFYKLTPEALAKTNINPTWFMTPDVSANLNDRSQTLLRKVRNAMGLKKNVEYNMPVYKGARIAAEYRNDQDMCRENGGTASPEDCKKVNRGGKLNDNTFFGDGGNGIRARDSLTCRNC